MAGGSVPMVVRTAPDLCDLVANTVLYLSRSLVPIVPFDPRRTQLTDTPHGLAAPCDDELAAMRLHFAPALAHVVNHSLVRRAAPGVVLPAAMWRTIYAVAELLDAAMAHGSEGVPPGNAAPNATSRASATAKVLATLGARAPAHRSAVAALCWLAAALHETGVTRAVPLGAMLVLASTAAGPSYQTVLGYDLPWADIATTDLLDFSWVLPS
jgi:hypothetical protein